MQYVANIPGLEEFTYIGGAVSHTGVARLSGNTSIRSLTIVTHYLPPGTNSVFASMSSLRSLTLCMSGQLEVTEAAAWAESLNDRAQFCDKSDIGA